MQRRKKVGTLKLQTFIHMPLQRQTAKSGFRDGTDVLHQRQHTMICAEQDMLPIVQKTESVSAPSQSTRPSARLPTGFKHSNINTARQRHCSRQTCPACADDGNFRAKMRSIHGLNPNNQVFRAIRFLRGEGMAIL